MLPINRYANTSLYGAYWSAQVQSFSTVYAAAPAAWVPVAIRPCPIPPVVWQPVSCNWAYQPQLIYFPANSRAC